MKNPTVLTVAGLNSGMEVTIDLVSLNKILDWFVKDAPREARDLKSMLIVAKLHNDIERLSNAEVDAANRKIERRVTEVISKTELEKSEGETIDPIDLLAGSSSYSKKPFKNIFEEDPNDQE